MHKSILLLGDRNQFIPFNYSQSANQALVSMGLNSGNNVFGFALQKMTLSKKTHVIHHTLSYFFSHIDEINSNFDAILYSPANMLAPWMKNTGMKEWIDTLKKLKIPVYFVGLGSQSDKYYNLDFIEDFKDEAYSFIKSILNTGGRIGLRGYFSAEVVKRIGFSEKYFSIVGCPSLFMNGSNLKIKKCELKKEELKPVFNGNTIWFNPEYHNLFGKFENSIFICQDLFYKLLYDPDNLTKVDAEYLRTDLFQWLFEKNRVRLYCDFIPWYNDMIDEKFNFSMGSRIHGNIVSLLAGIPAYIESYDSRVRELAEFFNIPHGRLPKNEIDLYEIYQEISYYKFNAEFKDKFYKFKNFINDCGIPCFEDEDYINDEMSKLHFNHPHINTSYQRIKEFTDEWMHIYYQ